MNAQLYRTQWGWGAVVYTVRGVKEILLPRSFKEEILQELKEIKIPLEDRPYTAVSQLLEYFAGKRTSFELYLDLSLATSFQQRVYTQAAQIPYGQTKFYQELAKAIGNPQAVRAVARALSVNPIPIVIPCHRVIQKNGQLGGFSSGVMWKSILLDLEKSQMKTQLMKQSEHKLSV